MLGVDVLHEFSVSGVAVAVLVLGVVALARVLAASRGTRQEHRRGAVICAPRTARVGRKHARTSPKAGSLRIGGIPIFGPDETRHFKILGTTGTGKTTAIRELLGGALLRGDRAVITDPGGVYLEHFFNPYRGDVILNPFEPRSVRWDLFAELGRPYDYEALARGLISRSDDLSGREWRGYARTFVAAVLKRCDEAGHRDTAQLWRTLAVAPSGELRRLVAGTPAEPFLDPENARMFGSIRSVAVSACAALGHIRAQHSVPFSIRNWVARGRGVLFIPYRASEIAALRSIIATWVRLAIFETMSDRPEESRRLWYVVDELDALGTIDGLTDALARLRRFAGRCVLGFQSIAQVSSCYGSGEAQTIVENCGNTLILRCAASERGGTAYFASRLIGEREVARRQISRGRDRSTLFSSRGMRHSTHVSEQIVTESAVLASEIEQLPDLNGYWKGASSSQWVRIDLTRNLARWRSTTSR